MVTWFNFVFILKDCLFWAVKLTENADPDKYFYSGYGIGFGSSSLFSFQNFDWRKNVIIFGVDNSLSVHTNNKKKIILARDEIATEGLDDTNNIIK